MYIIDVTRVRLPNDVAAVGHANYLNKLLPASLAAENNLGLYPENPLPSYIYLFIFFAPNMKLNILAITTLLGFATAAVVANRQETSASDDASVMLRGCKERYIDCQDCYDRYFACQQDSIPSSINWYGWNPVFC